MQVSHKRALNAIAAVVVAMVFLTGSAAIAQTHPQTKTFEDAYGVLPGGGGIYMESLYLPPVTTGTMVAGVVTRRERHRILNAR